MWYGKTSPFSSLKLYNDQNKNLSCFCSHQQYSQPSKFPQIDDSSSGQPLCSSVYQALSYIFPTWSTASQNLNKPSWKKAMREKKERERSHVCAFIKNVQLAYKKSWHHKLKLTQRKCGKVQNRSTEAVNQTFGLKPDVRVWSTSLSKIILFHAKY